MTEPTKKQGVSDEAPGQVVSDDALEKVVGGGWDPRATAAGRAGTIPGLDMGVVTDSVAIANQKSPPGGDGAVSGGHAFQSPADWAAATNHGLSGAPAMADPRAVFEAMVAAAQKGGR